MSGHLAMMPLAFQQENVMKGFNDDVSIRTKFRTFAGAERFVKQELKYRFFENLGFKEDVFKTYRKGSKVLAIKPLNRNYDTARYQILQIK